MLLFSPHNADTQIFQTTGPYQDTSLGGTWDGRIYLSSYHAGLWVVDIETLMLAGMEGGNVTDVHFDSTVGFISLMGLMGRP